MAQKKKKLVSSLAVFMMIICVLCIAAGLTSNLMFGGRNASPTVMGYQVYLNRTADMEPLVTRNAAVFVQAQHEYAKENVVLYTNSAGDKTIGRISLISADTEGQDARVIYYLNNASGTETAEIEKNSIIGLCRFENTAIGSALLVMTGTWGILLLIALPCVILLIYVISRFVAANAEDDEDEEEHSHPSRNGKRKPQSPLFNADSAKRADEDFAERKASLAEHFHQQGAEAGKKKKHKSDSRQKPADPEASRQRRAKNEAAEQLAAQEHARRQGEQAYAQDNDEDTESSETDARVAAIKRAMRQRAEERERIQAEEEQRIAASKAKQHAAQERAKQEAARETAEKPAVRTAAKTSPKPAQSRPARSSGPMDFEELMRQLDEEKKKLS